MLRLIIPTLVLLLGLPGFAISAPTVTAGTSYTGSPGSDPDTGNYTNAAGSNRVMLLFIACRDSADTVADPASAPTYAGNSMTQLVTTGPFNGVTLQSWLYYYVNPPSGSNAWSVDWPDPCNQILIVPMTVIDASQDANPFSNSSSGTGTGSPTVTCSSAAGELVIDMAFLNDGGHTITVGAGQTQLSNDSVGGGNLLGGTSYEAGAASVAMDWTLSAGTDPYGALCGSIKAAAVNAPSPMSRSLSIPGMNTYGLGGPLP